MRSVLLVSVGPGVIGQDTFDAVDAVAAEERGGPGEEGCAGGDLLVRVDLGVGQAGVVVDGGVQVVEAHAADGPACVAAVDFVAAAVGDPAEFLDIDVDQFSWALAFVAADDLAGGPVGESQPVQTVPGQDPVDGCGGQAQDRTDAGRAEFAVLPQAAHLRLGSGRSAVRCCPGPAGAVVQACFAFSSPAADPFVGRDAGDAHLGCDMGDGAAGVDTIDQQSPAEDGQPGITVGHEDLRAVKRRHLHHTGGLRH
ncbi:hypothetical protein SAMN05428945_6460 [Streptomyces sp. 2224.1]|nr:hypothetical protein SAMN05428945_6460 [Streptomyces sp. 2224.1]